MSIPDYQTAMLPVLRRLAEGGEHTAREIADELSTELGLSEDEVTELLPSGREPVWRSRVGWALQYLYQARAVARPRRGVFVATERGRQLLAAHPDRLGNDELEQFEEFRDFRARSRATRLLRESDTTAHEEAAATPDDRIEAAVAEANAAVASELLDRIHKQAPHFLETLVLQLLDAMGYTGALGDTDHLGRTGDEGLDGVVNQDALGLDRIYVQAKRYAPDRTVGRPEIQAFVGALHGQQASRGIFITTSKFSRDAADYIDRVPQRVVLIDGNELARLMIAHRVGVQVQKTAVLVKLDEDYFE